jgi:putative DNA primase/helicase
LTDDPFAPLGGRPAAARSAAGANARTDVRPVPAALLGTRPNSHRQLGMPSAIWAYRNARGEVLGYVCRFDPPSGKEFRPLCVFSEADGSLAWRWESWRSPRPLYGLDRLAAAPRAPVIVTEGEKSADAAGALLPGHIVVTSPNGSKGASKADWSVLAGRDVIIWPDADEPGEGYLVEVAGLLKAAGATRVRRLPRADDDSAAGWDAGDALAEGWTRDQATRLVASATPLGSAAELAGGARRAPQQRDQLLASADEFELWHSPEKLCFATCTIKGHREHWRLDSNAFKRILAGRYYYATGNALTAQLLADGIRVLEVRALEEGECLKAFSRIGHQADALWIDLCDAEWRAVRVTPAGWSVEITPPIKFVRSDTMLAMPAPESGGLIEQLRGFVNASDTDHRLIVGWIVAALWGRATTFPVLAIGGEQGSGKSTVSKMLRMLTDPSAVPIAAPPKEERDLFTMANSGHVLAFDNISKIDAWLSDAICRISTGSGFLTRKLHTDFEASWFHGSRPTILNGIPSLTERADLAERSLTVRLERIGPAERTTEADWWARWEVAWPSIFGALLDALSGALRSWSEVVITSKPRMADFAHLMAAAEKWLGWEAGDFERAYSFNRQSTDDAVFESDPIAVAIDRFIRNSHGDDGWEGTATMLLAELGKLVSEEDRRSRFWPSKPNALGNAVDRAAPLLRRRGIDVRKHNTGTQRLIRLTPRNTGKGAA